MALDRSRAIEALRAFEFKDLFIDELGWDNLSMTSVVMQVDGETLSLNPIAQKRGVQVFESPAQNGASIPTYQLRQKIERALTKHAREHLVVFTDVSEGCQVWQWVSRSAGRPTAYREEHYNTKVQSGEPLLHKLEGIRFDLAEEESVTLTDVTRRLKGSFDKDRIVKAFYERFQKEQQAFLRFITGILSEADRAWYTSLMLNRLMFIYFIQKKGFLDGDQDYLRTRLNRLRQQQGPGKFLSFYRYFLTRLFHEGLGQRVEERGHDLDGLLGKVPYLNGGLFEVHALEEQNPEVDIPDEAFDRIFSFFDQYDWYLDDRPLGNDREINPDVLGYIFEKYINQKQMGAYYTKEDITEYIARSTIIPHLFDVARKGCAAEFRAGGEVWRLLREDPDRYLFPAISHGVDQPLPSKIAAGVDDMSERSEWNRLAPPDFGLPTETWREVVARRHRRAEARSRLAGGDTTSISDFITYNLDLRQFAQDVIQNCESPELVRAFFTAIHEVTVLDPACGSGAFLFAALELLEPLYQACIQRMQAFLTDLDASGDPHSPKKFDDFRKTLTRVADHPNQVYFILKSIVINNLYGVDIMEEAVEICKLRLFLKLVAQVDKREDVEPLPDIDFNIRAGNTLVGFTDMNTVREALTHSSSGQKRMPSDEDKAAVDGIEAQAAACSLADHRFRSMQMDHGMGSADFADAKQELHRRLHDLSIGLDRWLATEYGLDPHDEIGFRSWQDIHLPFHWFIEFHQIMQSGGFDVIIGNPPYVERAKFTGDYWPLGLATEGCRDIYAWFLERAPRLGTGSSRVGMIVPISLVASESFAPVRRVLWSKANASWVANFAHRPSQLFDGAGNRLAILLYSKSAPSLFSTRYHRWDGRNGERGSLFENIIYTDVGSLRTHADAVVPKIGSAVAASVLQKLSASRMLRNSLVPRSEHKVHWVRVPGYFCQFFLRPPLARPEAGGQARLRGELNSVSFREDTHRLVSYAALNSSTYYFWHCAWTDGRHINPSDVHDFPLDLTALSRSITSELELLSQRLDTAFRANTSLWRKSGLLIDSVNSAACKSTLDEIDGVLAEIYGFTPDEYEFIVNYDFKYRMGTEGSSE